LNHRRIVGFAGLCPSQGVPRSASGVCGVDAREVRMVFVRTGVKWMCFSISSWAAMTEGRVRGGVLARSAIV
jgi:hypothetical protein